MSKPWIHAVSSAKLWGGTPSDYIAIHNLLDSSKATMADSRHRALTHNSWFIGYVLEQVFGTVFKNSDDKIVSVRDVGERHVLEDYAKRFIPTPQDFLQDLPFAEWMLAGKGEPPASYKLLDRRKNVTSNA